MTDTTASLQRKIGSAGDLHAVVRTMKAMAAASISQYENAMSSLDHYYETVEQGLAACVQHQGVLPQLPTAKQVGTTAAVVFGSDQGLVGPFNDVMADFVTANLNKMPGKKIIWTVGERIQSRLSEMHSMSAGSIDNVGQTFILPNSVESITPLVAQILTEIQMRRERCEISQVYLFHHRPAAGAVYKPVSQRLLPLDHLWRSQLASISWPTKMRPEIMNDGAATLLAFVREYLFVSLFRACAASLSSENASRLAAMQRAERNIDELLDDLRQTFNRLRQSRIDEELFDVVSGFEALTT